MFYINRKDTYIFILIFICWYILYLKRFYGKTYIKMFNVFIIEERIMEGRWTGKEVLILYIVFLNYVYILFFYIVNRSLFAWDIIFDLFKNFNKYIVFNI